MEEKTATSVDGWVEEEVEVSEGKISSSELAAKKLIRAVIG